MKRDKETNKDYIILVFPIPVIETAFIHNPRIQKQWLRYELWLPDNVLYFDLDIRYTKHV